MRVYFIRHAGLFLRARSVRGAGVVLPMILSMQVLAAQYYVAPNGKDTAPGNLENPLSLSKALSAASPARPGDTLWVRGGTYIGPFLSSLAGTSNNPIIVRNYNNERAIIDTPVVNPGSDGMGVAVNGLDWEGTYTWFWGLEIMNSATNRLLVRSGGVGGNVSYPGAGAKLINCVIHDTGSPVFLSWISTNAEVTGCVIYNNGWQNTTNLSGFPDRGHGHGIYAQGTNPATKVFQENIIFNQFCEGIQIYSQNGPVRGFDIKGNTLFMNGVISSGTNHYYNIEVGGGQPVERLTLRENMTYDFYVPYDNTSVTIGENLASTNNDATIVSNCFVGGGFNIFYWTNITFLSNTIALADAGGNGYNAIIHTIPNANPYVFDYNHYYWPYGGPFATNGVVPSFSDWQGMGYDTHGIVTVAKPTNFWAFVRVNPYETNRANITVYNWQTNDNVSVNVSNVLSVGMTYQVKNVQDFLGPAVASGTYSGGLISLPMTNLMVATPIGLPYPPAPTGPTFNAFVVLPVVSPPPPPKNLNAVAPPSAKGAGL
jgi:hypothetical protein